MKKIFVLETHNNPMVDPTYLRIITFDVDDGKPFCYRSRMSYNAFFHSWRNRNKSPSCHYIARTEEEHETELKVWAHMMKNFPALRDIHDIPMIDVKNIWEFYRLVDYDHKIKRWTYT